MANEGAMARRLKPEDRKHLQRIIHKLRADGPARQPRMKVSTRGEKIADRVAATVGSWRFIIVQSSLLACWIALNLIGFINHWDPYPFILLNLVLSFQAAYTAPIIMMSQNRQAEIDRRNAEHDYDVNVKAELEIELLHQKIDAMRETEILRLISIIERLENLFGKAEPEAPKGA
jgi:uncharacterized membrane protein